MPVHALPRAAGTPAATAQVGWLLAHSARGRPVTERDLDSCQAAAPRLGARGPSGAGVADGVHIMRLCARDCRWQKVTAADHNGGTARVLPDLPHHSAPRCRSASPRGRPRPVRRDWSAGGPAGRWPRSSAQAVPCRGTTTSCWSWRAIWPAVEYAQPNYFSGSWSAGWGLSRREPQLLAQALALHPLAELRGDGWEHIPQRAAMALTASLSAKVARS
jgi:hypothetical protein